jgi:protein-S-isoprenylcysteine O-methyltransferase Ste14
MMPSKPARDHLGSALVAAQFGLIAALAWWAAAPFLQGRAPLPAWALAAAGAVLGLWTLAHNRPGNFNVRPTPREGGHLVHTGPYRWIRHPMYTAVIACGAACAWAAGSALAWFAAAALVAVLAVKAHFEERWMLQRHQAYADYRARTRRFLPFVV